jgi:hypothetical protein
MNAEERAVARLLALDDYRNEFLVLTPAEVSASLPRCHALVDGVLVTSLATLG